MLTTRYDKIEAEPFSFLLVFRCVRFNIILIIGNILTLKMIGLLALGKTLIA